MKVTFLFQQEAIKRLSLPTDIKLPEEFLAKISKQSAQQQLNENLTRKTRRASLVSLSTCEFVGHCKSQL